MPARILRRRLESVDRVAGIMQSADKPAPAHTMPDKARHTASPARHPPPPLAAGPPPGPQKPWPAAGRHPGSACLRDISCSTPPIGSASLPLPQTAAASTANSWVCLLLSSPAPVAPRPHCPRTTPPAPAKSIGQQVCCLHVRSLGVSRLLKAMLESRRRLPVLPRELLCAARACVTRNSSGCPPPPPPPAAPRWLSQQEIADQMLRRDIRAAVHPQLVLPRQLPLRLGHPAQRNQVDEQVFCRDRILRLQLHRFLRIGQRLLKLTKRLVGHVDVDVAVNCPG
jgi:hypothetical protein